MIKTLILGINRTGIISLEKYAMEKYCHNAEKPYRFKRNIRLRLKSIPDPWNTVRPWNATKKNKTSSWDLRGNERAAKIEFEPIIRIQVKNLLRPEYQRQRAISNSNELK